MTQKELQLLYAYILSNRVRLENDVRNLQNNLRFRDIDIVDCIELIHAKTQLQCFIEITNQIKLILQISDNDGV